MRLPAAVELRTEKQLEAQVKQLCQMFGWLYYHTTRSQWSPAGFPDIVAVHSAQKRIIYAELKRTSKQKLAPEQVVWRDALCAVGAEYYIWTWSTPPEDIVNALRPNNPARA